MATDRSRSSARGVAELQREDKRGNAVRPEYALKLSEAELARYTFMARSTARMEQDLWDAAGVVEGTVVAEVGCGPGAISAGLG